MTKALESFKSYLIEESNKGPDQLKWAQYSYPKPEILTKAFESGKVSIYDHPKVMENDNPGMSPEEDSELRSMGFASTSEIEYVSARNAKLEYDIIPMWDKSGIENMLFIPKKITMTLEVETWDEAKDDTVTTYIEVVDDNIGDRFEWDDARQPFPIEPTSIEVNMHESFDSSKFSYEFTIGDWR